MIESNKITIVTGFFDCKRGENIKQNRSNDKYFEYFEFWARIQNDVIIFGDKETVNRAFDIRKKFGRAQQTKVICIDNITEIEPKIYSMMCKIEKNGEFKKWRIRDYDISNEALYDYIMFLKFWMLKEAQNHINEPCTLAWVDFGYNHGGKFYTNSNEFDYLWQYQFKKDKIHLFSLEKYKEELGYLKLMLMTDKIIGGIFLCDSTLCSKFYEIMRNAMFSLLSIDVFDDDQMLLTMGYKLYPELFTIHESDWFFPLKQFGGEHLSIKINNSNSKKISDIKRKNICYNLKWLYCKVFFRLSVEQYNYKKRLINMIRHYK